MEAGTAQTVKSQTIAVEVNGVQYEREVDARRLLIHFIRDDLGLTGSHIGCDTGNCGACSIIVDGMMLMSATALLRQSKSPSDDEIRRAIQGNLCRCTGYVNIVEAIKAAAK